ncbi:MAG: ABC transporter ATP-binding protein [Candidatus Bathyarchaeia archaeon]
MPSEAAISLVHVKKSYNGRGKVVNVFDDVSLQIMKGEFVAVVGPTGCGKTTLINLISGLDRPISGEISIDQTRIDSLSEDDLTRLRATKMGVVFQAQNLFPELSVCENLELPLAILGFKGEAREAMVKDTLKEVGLNSLADRKAGNLSVGERLMVGIARALVKDPPIVLMDEPTECLDPLTTESVLTLLRSSNILKGRTILVTTHSRRVTQTAERVIHLRKRIP